MPAWERAQESSCNCGQGRGLGVTREGFPEEVEWTQLLQGK